MSWREHKRTSRIPGPIALQQGLNHIVSLTRVICWAGRPAVCSLSSFSPASNAAVQSESLTISSKGRSQRRYAAAVPAWGGGQPRLQASPSLGARRLHPAQPAPAGAGRRAPARPSVPGGGAARWASVSSHKRCPRSHSPANHRRLNAATQAARPRARAGCLWCAARWCGSRRRAATACSRWSGLSGSRTAAGGWCSWARQVGLRWGTVHAPPAHPCAPCCTPCDRELKYAALCMQEGSQSTVTAAWAAPEGFASQLVTPAAQQLHMNLLH